MRDIGNASDVLLCRNYKLLQSGELLIKPVPTTLVLMGPIYEALDPKLYRSAYIYWPYALPS
jgi:hypothetical protein